MKIVQRNQVMDSNLTKEQHADKGMVNLKTKRCDHCESTSANSKYDKKCARCFFVLHPNDERLTNYKTREHAFMLPLKKYFKDIDIDMILDKRIEGGQSKRRPDGLIRCKDYSVVVEIDEDQHAGYDPLCENCRIMEIFQDLGNRKIVFIRLNPDAYMKKDGKKARGVYTKMFKLNQTEFDRRMPVLIAAVEEAISNSPNREISIIQLFFDEK